MTKEALTATETSEILKSLTIRWWDLDTSRPIDIEMSRMIKILRK